MSSAGLAVLYLVRHGESGGNVDPELKRSDDPPLTERGHDQAAHAAAALAKLGIDAVLSSHLRRARETAEVIAAAAGMAPQVAEGFGEVDMGALGEAQTSEGRVQREAIFSAWLAGDLRRAFPGGEDFGAVLRRVEDGLQALLGAAPGARVVLVTHRMPIAAAAVLCGPGTSAGPPGACPNGSITTLRPEGQTWRLVSWAEARHLA